MANVKGTNLCQLRKLLQEKGAQIEQQVLARLSPENQELYHSVLATSMSPADKQVQIYEAAANVLFSDDPMPLRRLGKELSSRSYQGVYKLFLRIPTTTFIISKAAQIWNTFFDVGTMSIENVGKNQADLVLRDFPDVPKGLLEYTCGHTECLLTSAGAKKIRITLIDKDPNAWRWEIFWS